MGDPVYGYFRLTAPSGNITVKKSSEDGALEGFTFRVSGNGVSRTGKTDANGTVTFVNLPVGTYAVEEIETPSWYDQPAAQAATVTGRRQCHPEFLQRQQVGIYKDIQA